MKNNVIALIIIAGVLYFVFNGFENFTDSNDEFIIDDEFADQNYMLDTNQNDVICSRSCCAKTWPTGIEDNDSIYGVKPSDIGTKYISTNEFCTNGYTEGCVCADNVKN